MLLTGNRTQWWAGTTTHFVESWLALKTVEEPALGGKGIFFKKLSTKPSVTHWFPGVLHSRSKLRSLNPEHRPTALPPWAKSSLLNKAL